MDLALDNTNSKSLLIETYNQLLKQLQVYFKITI